jgi:hypothetical protein
MRFFTSGFFHETTSPRPLIAELGARYFFRSPLQCCGSGSGSAGSETFCLSGSGSVIIISDPDPDLDPQ